MELLGKVVINFSVLLTLYLSVNMNHITCFILPSIFLFELLFHFKFLESFFWTGYIHIQYLFINSLSVQMDRLQIVNYTTRFMQKSFKYFLFSYPTSSLYANVIIFRCQHILYFIESEEWI